MGKYKGIPIRAAKVVAEKYEKDQVIIATWDKVHNKTHITTYGKTVEDCDQAAQGGNVIKKALGWPENMCKEEPSRVTKIKAEITSLKARIKEISEEAPGL